MRRRARGYAPAPMTELLDDAGLDPAVPAAPPAQPRRWWGRHLAEFRWQAELARLLVDPVYRGEGVERGDGMPVLLVPGFLAGDATGEAWFVQPRREPAPFRFRHVPGPGR